jgi:solute carrier family 25 protein 33/36
MGVGRRSKVALRLQSSTRHLYDTFQLLFTIPLVEGWRALFKGYGPNLTGIVLASAIKFHAYGNCKRSISDTMNGSRESAWVHLNAVATAGTAAVLAFSKTSRSL